MEPSVVSQTTNEELNESTDESANGRKPASRLRLTAIATLVAAVVMLCAGLALMTLQHRLQTDNVDEKLQAQSREIEQVFDAGNLPLVLEQGDSEDEVAQVVYAGTVLASTDNMSSQRALPSPDGDVRRQSTTLAISDSPYRLLSRDVGDQVVIHTGLPMDHVEEADDSLRTALAFIIPAVTLVFGFLAWWLLGRRTT